jgi:16S rRNA C967 or C1407 C5-methylase (RsmB/RsmF family)
MSDIKLTKKQMTELLKDAYPEDDEQDILRAVDRLKKTRWIVKDEVERVIEEWNNRLNNLVMWQEKNDKIQGLLIIETAQKVIDLLQKRIQELEAGE